MLEGLLKRRGIPRLVNVFVNGTGINGRDSGVHIGVRRHENAEEAWIELPGLFEQPYAFFTGHTLVRHENADLILVFLQQLKTISGVGGGQHAESMTESTREEFQRLFF